MLVVFNKEPKRPNIVQNHRKRTEKLDLQSCVVSAGQSVGCIFKPKSVENMRKLKM